MIRRETFEPYRRPLRAAAHVFATLLLVGIWYRLRLAAFVAAGLPESGSEGPETSLWFGVFHYAFEEGLLAAAIALLVGTIVAGASLLGRRVFAVGSSEVRWRSPLRFGGRIVVLAGAYGALAALLLLIAAAYQTNVGVWRSMNAPLGYALLLEGMASGIWLSLRELTATLSGGELFFVASPLLIWGLFVAMPARLMRYRDGLSAVLCVALVALALVPSKRAARQPEGIRRTPLYFAARDAWRTTRRRVPPLAPAEAPRPMAAKPAAAAAAQASAQRPLSRTQSTSVALVDPLFVSSVEPSRKLPADAAKERWNVVMIVMESTGLSYLHKQERGLYPMPFLRQLATRGLSLRNHFAPGNTSPRTIFSLFSGLYPMPNYRIYAMRKGLAYPSLFTLAHDAGDYQSLLVTPASLGWYFPRDFFRLSGPRSLYDYATVKVKEAPKPAHARHEEASVGFFIKKLRSVAQRPFVAVYYSFVAHWPYPDFGKRYERYPPGRKLYRYLNNLYLLDTQIERIFTAVKELGLAQRTIFVMVGDHGEAFGQHKGNWTHSRHSFNENYQTPMVFHQPRLFTPREVFLPTTHVDVLPTLLDAMNIPHNPRLLQGESLFQDVLRRRYVFLYGNEDTLSSVSREGIKLQISFKQRKCWVYDLKADPTEQRRRSCKNHGEQHKAALAYQAYQRKLLVAYNKAAQDKRDFFGQRHHP